MDVSKLLEQRDAIYHGGQPPFDYLYDFLIAEGHKIDFPEEKAKMWNLAKYNSNSDEESVILYKSYLVKKYLVDSLKTKGKLEIYFEGNEKPIKL